MTREPSLSIIVVPEDGGASRTFRISRTRKWALQAAGVTVAFILMLGAGSWVVLAVRSAQVPELRAEIARLEADQARTRELALALDGLERRYERLRTMLGAGSGETASSLWLPPPTSGGSASAAGGAQGVPSAWPLADRGFVTQSLLEPGEGEHPGVDIAIPAHTYVRATAAGSVVEVGDDPIYGFYVALDHGQGYRSLYAHAAETLVTTGQPVRAGEVIALSGSTGRSTAPHLHFEITRNGTALDPLTMVRPPS